MFNINDDLKFLSRSLAASADARAIVSETRARIEASLAALRECEARVERRRERNQWCEWMTDVEPDRFAITVSVSDGSAADDDLAR